MNNICIFEDSHYKKLLPLVWTKAVYELRCGASFLLEKITRHYKNHNVYLYCRDYIEPVLKERYRYFVNTKIKGEKILFINGRVLIKDKIKLISEEEIGVKDKTLVYAFLKKENAEILTPELFLLENNIVGKLKNNKIKIRKVEFELITYPWDLINKNSEEIVSDFKLVIKKGRINEKIYKGVNILNKSQVYIGKGSKIKPGVVLDAEEGPIYIGKDVLVEPNAVIQGPVFIGDKSIIRPGAKIREGTSIGEFCRVGGEVEKSIIHSYSNKQHDGFLGHSYIGSWCNLGAGTNTSDLKNNYSTVKVYIDSKEVDSGLMFVGLTMADHSKSAIGTQFNTGTVVGVSCNVFGNKIPPKYVPSFSWGILDESKEYKLEKAIETAKKVMLRRNVKISDAEINLLKKVFELTQRERMSKSR
ncbi:MAG: GlmU family protein [Endomicrobiia bacterium]